MAFRFAGHSRDTAQRGDPIRSRATFIDSVSVDPIISIPYPASLSLHANLPIARLHNNDSLYSIVKALDWKNLHPEEAKI